MALARSSLLGLLRNCALRSNNFPGKLLSFLGSAAIGIPATCIALSACEATPDGEPPLPSDITLETADNYQVTIELSIPELAIDPAAPIFDWSQITDNLRGEPIAPTDITLLTLARFDGKMATEITQRLETGEGVSNIASAAGKLVPSGTTTSGSLVDFESTTNTYEGLIPVVDFFAIQGTYLLSFATGSEQGQGTQAIVYLKPQPGATSTTAPLMIPTGSQQLATYTPTLAPAVEVPANTAPGVIGWGNVQKDGLGLVIGAGFANINRVFLAFYADKPLSDFNAKDAFLRIERDATKLWQKDIDQPEDVNMAIRSVDLGQLSSSGEAFSQFDLSPGTWIFAAMCDNCNNPAMIVTPLQPIAN